MFGALRLIDEYPLGNATFETHKMAIHDLTIDCTSILLELESTLEECRLGQSSLNMVTFIESKISYQNVRLESFHQTLREYVHDFLVYYIGSDQFEYCVKKDLPGVHKYNTYPNT